MTKKELAAFEELQLKLRMVMALRMTNPVKPDVAPPTESFKLTTGWLFNSHSRRVNVACSSVTSHSFSRNDKTDSQRPVWLYSSKKLALQAMRHELELEFARALLLVDEQIEEADNGTD